MTWWSYIWETPLPECFWAVPRTNDTSFYQAANPFLSSFCFLAQILPLAVHLGCSSWCLLYSEISTRYTSLQLQVWLDTPFPRIGWNSKKSLMPKQMALCFAILLASQMIPVGGSWPKLQVIEQTRHTTAVYILELNQIWQNTGNTNPKRPIIISGAFWFSPTN